MQKGPQPSWLVFMDAPRDLNFAIYTACCHDLMPTASPFGNEQLWSAFHSDWLDEADRIVAGEQWLVWWDEMARDRAECEIHGRWSKYYAPNGVFDWLEEPLRTCCEQAFESFCAWWGLTAGGQQAVNYWADQAEVHGFVRQVETEKGRTAHPFQLTVDYVYTGLSTILDVNSTYAIMSVHRPQLSIRNREWWLRKIRELA